MGSGYSVEQMQTLASVVTLKGAEDARRSFCSGHGGCNLLRHGRYNTAGVQPEDMLGRVTRHPHQEWMEQMARNVTMEGILVF
jgi:hypothetical protein